MKMLDEPTCSTACITLPSGPRWRSPRSEAPNTFLYQSIALAAPSTTTDAVTVERPSGMYLFALAMISSWWNGRARRNSPPASAVKVKGRPSAARAGGGSHAREPFVAEVLPISACANRLEDHLVHPLDHFVAELHRRVEAERRALLERHGGAVAPVGEDGLRMLGALPIPARVVADGRSIFAGLAALEAAELHESGPRIGATEPRDLGDA